MQFSNIQIHVLRSVPLEGGKKTRIGSPAPCRVNPASFAERGLMFFVLFFFLRYSATEGWLLKSKNAHHMHHLSSFSAQQRLITKDSETLKSPVSHSVSRGQRRVGSQIITWWESALGSRCQSLPFTLVKSIKP